MNLHRDRIRHRRHLTVFLLLALALSATVVACSAAATPPQASRQAPPSPIGSPTSALMTPGMSMAATPPGPAINLTTTSPAGNITLPDPNMTMAPGMAMAGPTCTTSPTTAQQAAAVALVGHELAGLQQIPKPGHGESRRLPTDHPTGQPVVHYLNPAYYRATIIGGPILNAAAPQSLVYANTAHGAILAAAMYIAPRRTGTPPQPGGCLTQWHIHTNLCMAGGAVIAEADPSCPTGSVNRITPPMLHIWFIPIPGGPTAIDAPDSQVVQATQKVPAGTTTTA